MNTPGPTDATESWFSPTLLSGKTALVSGGGTGIGRSIAESLARAGADLVLASRRLDLLEVAAAEIRSSTGRRVDIAEVNIRDHASVKRLGAVVAHDHGAVDILVNNAGGQFPQAARHYSAKGWHAVIETNLTGTWSMTQILGLRCSTLAVVWSARS